MYTNHVRSVVNIKKKQREREIDEKKLYDSIYALNAQFYI